MNEMSRVVFVFAVLSLIGFATAANPVISDVKVESVYGTTAVITWTTDVPSTSRVYYSTSTPPGAFEEETAMVTSHSVKLWYLTTCTTWYFSVLSHDGTGPTTDNNGGSYYQFKTGLDTQPAYNASGLPVTIPSESYVDSTISVSEAKPIVDINVNIGYITHYRAQDLLVSLIAPDSTVIPLAFRQGVIDGSNFDGTTFDDEAQESIITQLAPFTGTFRPCGALSHLNGKNANGTWTLRIENVFTYTGTLDSWGIDFTFGYEYCEEHASIKSYVINDVCTGTGDGDDNGVIDAGEDAGFEVTLYNDGNANLTGVTGTLTTSTPGITITDGSASFPSININSDGTSITNHFSFGVVVSKSCGDQISLNLHVASTQKPAGWDLPLTLTIGDVPPTSATVLDEDFVFGIPVTWTVVDGGDNTGAGAAATWTTGDPCPLSMFWKPLVSPPFAIVDSDCAEADAVQDEQLITPVMDLGAAGAVYLEFDHVFVYFEYEKGDVDVKSSLTSGVWTNVARYELQSTPLDPEVDPPVHENIDISPYAAGASDVQVRFHYYDGQFELFWGVDNIKVSYTAGASCDMDRCCPIMTDPVITSIVDDDVCAQSGVTITFTTSSPATRHDLYKDAVLAQSNVTSPLSYNPGDTSSHSYHIRAVNVYEDCMIESLTSAATDENRTPAAPVISSVTDVDACATSGVTITWGAASQATAYDFRRDSSDATIVLNVTSPYVYSPGDNSSHNYQIRGKNLSCTGPWSDVQAGADVNDKPGAPAITAVTDVDACATNGVKVTFTAGSPAGLSYNLLRDGAVVVTGYTSGATYQPGDNTSHNYIVRAIKNTCSTDSPQMAGTDVNDTPGAPNITGITDVNLCAQSGIQVAFTAGTPSGSSYNLLRDSVVVVTGYVSGATYNPGDTSSHTYIVQAVVGTCTTNSTGSAFTDLNNTPGAPAITGITDVSLCAQSGIQVAFTAGTPAGSSYNLLRDEAVVVTGYTSGATYNPGDTSSHAYKIRAVVGTCTTDSTGSSFTDLNNTPGAPTITGITDINACSQSGIQVAFTAGTPAGSSYNLLRNDTIVVTGYTSGATYDPGSTTSYTYKVQAVVGACTTTSTGSSFADGNHSVAAPSAPTVTDINACALSGVSISWGAVTGATSYDLLEGSTNIIPGVTSPYTYLPGDTSNHVYRIMAKNAYCSSGWSSYTIGKDANYSISAPSAPTVTDINSCLTNGVSVSWGAVSGATGYDLYVDATTTVESVTSPYTYTPGNNASHNYQVRAKNASCVSSWSSPTACIDVNDTPGAPSITGITDENACAQNGIRVNYTAGSGATSHNLLRDAALVVTGYVSGALYVPGDSSEHTYIVKAIKSGCSADSPGQAATDVSDAVGAPVITGIVDDDACGLGIRVSYTAGSGANSHDLYRDGALAVNNYASGAIYSPGDSSSHSYYIHATKGVCYTNSDAQSFSDTNLAVGAPSTPGVADVSACALSGVNVTWNAVSGATGYDLRFDGTTITTGVTSPHTYSPGNTSSHNYEIRAKNASCTGDWSTATAGIDANGTPSQPSITSIIDNDPQALTGLTINFTSGSPATQHDLYKDGSLAQASFVSGSTYSPGDSTAHDYVIRAINGACFANSPAVQGQDVQCATPTAPVLSSVTDVSACAQSGVTVTFTAGAPVTQHDLYVGGSLVQANITSPYVYDPGDTASHAYVVRAVNGACTTDSNTVNAADANNSISAPTISSVTDVAVCATSGVTVTWGAVSGATGYDLRYNGATIVTDVTSPHVYQPGDTSAHNYEVRAKNASCMSGWSTPFSGTDVNSTPAQPTISSVTDIAPCATSGVTVAWGTVPGATGYDLRYNGVTIVTGVTSPTTYNPGDNASHNYEIRAKNASCTGSWSLPAAGTDLNESVSTPSAPTVVDVDPCAFTGVSISWSPVSGATTYDLLEGSTNVTPNVTSPYVYHPIDTDNHVYRIMAKSAHCSSGWSAYTIGKDANGVTPSQPSITSVVDNNPLLLNGVIITFTAGSPATQTNLWRDGAQVATNITSPYLHAPGDSLSHNYVVRTYNGVCYADSTVVAGADLAGCTAPVQEVTDDKAPAGDKTQFTWTAITADNYRVVRGLKADLANLITSSSDFSCYAFGASTNVNISADDPIGQDGRCYYYLVQGYNGTDPDLCVGPAGNATAGARQVETPANCD